MVGEVGRGTFVSSRRSQPNRAFTEPSQLRVDLELIFPILPDQATAIAKSLGSLMQGDAMGGVLPAMHAAGTAAGRGIAARFLSRQGWAPISDQVLFTGNGKQAIAAAIAALVPPGGRIGTEAVTYPFIKGLAERLGVTLVPLVMDQHGVRADRVKAAHASAPLSALYLQPVLHNPLGMTMPKHRREELARIVRERDLIVIEDAVYSFLSDDPPLAALIPESCVIVDSLSKRISPGLTIGFVVSPLAFADKAASAVRSGAWQASAFAYDAALRLMADGTASSIVRAKRGDACKRQAIARRALSGLALTGNARSYHLWLELPGTWRSEQLVAAAARHGIALAPSSAFAVREGHAPNAIRIALASPPVAELRRALEVLARLLRSAPQDAAAIE